MGYIWHRSAPGTRFLVHLMISRTWTEVDTFERYKSITTYEHAATVNRTIFCRALHSDTLVVRSNMATIRVASSTCRDERSRALATLSKWAFRHAKRNSPRVEKQPTIDALIRQTHVRQIASRERIFRRNLPFSWGRFLIGLVSLALVFSDVFRSSIGVSDLKSTYPELQPDEAMNFGTSWNYSVFAATRAEIISSGLKAKVWAYKFDTTSISWRVFVRFLNVTQFPPCLLYTKLCPDAYVEGTEAFEMIDSVVTAVALRRANTSGPVGLTLRSENEYIDRLHQFIFPTWFTNINWRTNQALYYSPQLLSQTNARSVCFPKLGGRELVPRFCVELWTNLDRSCDPRDLQSRAAGLLYVHTMKRLRDGQERFPNSTIDLTFLESQEDMQVCRGGLTSAGFRRTDVSTIIRARNCTDSGACKTFYVDDYRYETGLLISDVVQWYRVVAPLRIIGQCYFWCRGMGLIVGCYFLFGNTNSKAKQSIWTHARKARDLFMKMPTQCVVYGSSFPILCYVLAHLLDAPFTYDVLDSKYFSQAGILDINLESFIPLAVVQMRNLWIYALVWYAVATVLASRWVYHDSQLNFGVIGVPEFLISTFSSITLLAQYRSTSYRSSKILRIVALTNNLGRAWVATKYQYSFAHRGRGTVSLGGVIIDLKFLLCFVLFVITVGLIQHAVQRFCWHKLSRCKLQDSHLLLLPPTPVPYSGGVLWPSGSLSVHWTRAFYCIQDKETQDHPSFELVRRKKYENRYRTSKTVSRLSARHDARVIASDSFSFANNSRAADQQTQNIFSLPQTRKTAGSFRYIQHQLNCLHRRSNEAKATVAFMNAILMSDPLVYLRIFIGTDPSTTLGYYQSVWNPGQIVLLPVVVVGEHNEFTAGLKLLRRVNASQLTWSELVQCG